MCEARDFPASRVGVVDSGLGADEGFDDQVLQVTGLFTLPLAELRRAHEATLPALFG
jgi:phosphoribosylformylglycinamidine synthase